MKQSRFRGLLKTGDKNFVEIIKHSIWALAILGLATGIQFVFDLLMAREFGASGTGVFYLCFSLIIALSLFGHIGLDRTVVRLIPPLLVKKDYAAANSLKRTTLHIVIFNTLLITTTLFVISPWLAETVFHDSQLTLYFRIFSLALPFYSLRFIYGGILRAIKKTRESLLIERVIIYAIGILAIFTLGARSGIKGMSWGFVIGCIVSVVVGIWFVNKLFPKSKQVEPFSKKVLLASGVPLLFVAFGTQMIGQTSVLILGSVGTTADVGVYNAALKVSLTLTLILTAINTIAGTTISELFAQNEKGKLEKIFGKTSSLGFLLGLPLFLIMFIFPEFILGLFGNEFVGGVGALRILAIGQLVNIIVGPTLFILAMTGREKALAKTVISSLVVNILIGVLIIPTYTVQGAAIATAVTIACSNLIMLVLVRRYFGVWSLPFKFLGLWASKVVRKDTNQYN